MQLSEKLSFLLIVLLCFASFELKAARSCLSELKRSEIESRLDFLADRPKYPKQRKARVYYPKDFVEGDERDVLVYLHGFGSNADAYQNKDASGSSVQEKISAIFSERHAREPVVLSFSMGPTTIAGVREHGADHPFFLPVEDYWSALELSLADLPLSRRRLFFLANSGGAFSVFQMLRQIPVDIEVAGAVLCALPHFTQKGFADNPALQENGSNFDILGTQLRAQLESIVGSFLSDPYFANLQPHSSLNDGTLPRNIPVLIQGGRWDALGYTQLNSNFTLRAQELGFPISMHEVLGGHAGGIDNEATVDFLLRLP